MTASTVRKKGIRDVFEILHHSRYFLEFKYFPIIYELEKLFLKKISRMRQPFENIKDTYFSYCRCGHVYQFVAKLPNLVFLFPDYFWIFPALAGFSAHTVAE